MSHFEHALPALGIDVGGVLIGATDPTGVRDTYFLEASEEGCLETPPVPDSFDAIARLNSVFEGRVYLVSKCGPRVERKTRRWLVHHRFFEHTGLPSDHVRFCRERPEKRLHAVQLGLTHFVDDRLDVLDHLRGLVPYLFWFGHQRGGRDAADLTRVLSWAKAEAAIRRTL